MPFVRVEAAGGEGVEAVAGFERYVCDHETGGVEWEMVMEGLGEHAVAGVEEEDAEEDYGG